MSCLRFAVGILAAAAFLVAAPAGAPAQPPAPPQSTAPPPAENGTPAPVRPEQPQSVTPFVEESALTAKTIIFRKGTATWDSAFETLIAAFKSVKAFVEQQGLKAAGPFMAIYLETDDTGFHFQAGLPVEEEPKTKPGGEIAVGKSPEGKALKFVHQGSYDAMDNTYEVITNYLDEKRLESKDMFIEEYITDPLTTAEDELVIHVLVPLK